MTLTRFRSTMYLRFLLKSLLILEIVAITNFAAKLAVADTPNFHRTYAGKIGERYSINIDLRCFNGVLAGKYRYKAKSHDIDLRGTIDSSGSFSLKESADGLRRTGTFLGVIAKDGMLGVWKSLDGTRTLRFQAEVSKDFDIKSKKEILTGAIGEYYLKEFSGGGGVGLWYTWKDNGKWHSNLSELSEGKREAVNKILSTIDGHQLDKIRVVIDSTLRMQLLVGQKAILSIPYEIESPIVEMRDGAHEKRIENELAKISFSTPEKDGVLYLLAKDGVDYSNLIRGDFGAPVAGVVIVSYYLLGDSINVNFVDTAGTNLVFTRGAGSPLRY
jgi:hypothetical protein